MVASQKFTQTIITHVKEGINLDDAGETPTKRAFIRLVETVKSQKGCKSQYWGHQVEHPNLFVWCIDWESLEHYRQCTEFQVDSSSNKLFDEAFDMATKPLTLLTKWTTPLPSKWASSPRAAFNSKVTEIAFYTLPNGATEAAKADIEKSFAPIDVNVQRVGKATGASTGWAFEPTNPTEEWLHGVFGYDSIEDHMTWRQQPEHEMAMEVMKGLADRLVSFNVARVPGVDLDTGYFHVEFKRSE